MATTHFKECLSIAVSASAVIAAIKAYDHWTSFPDDSSTAVQPSEDGPPDLPAPSNGRELCLYTPPPGQAPPPRQAIRHRTRDDQRRFLAEYVLKDCSLFCECDKCAPNHYFDWPLSCSVKHSAQDIVIQPRGRPLLMCPGSKYGIYEELSLARCTIEYFSRPRQDMDPIQLQGWKQCRELLYNCGWMTAFNEDDPRNSLADVVLQDLANALNKLFFFGAINNLTAVWDTQILDKPKELGTFGLTGSGCSNGSMYSSIWIHPTRLSRLYTPPSGHRGMALAEQRLGTLLHELLHAFLDQYACKSCKAAKHNTGGHNRPWQRIAKAIEEESWKLLGVDVDLERLTAMRNDVLNKELRPSIHDLEEWGFLEPYVLG